MSNEERVVNFLQSIAPSDASNSEIAARTGIKPHQQVFQITRKLMQTGRIKGVQSGREWCFRYVSANSAYRQGTPQAINIKPIDIADGLLQHNVHLSPRESVSCDRIRHKEKGLREFLSKNNLLEPMGAHQWLGYLTEIKDILGNINNDIGFIATLLVKAYLERRFGVTNFDASGKPQGASGIDIQAVSSDGKAVAGELKTTKPYQPGFGAQQRAMILKDLARLAASAADHRFMFVTDAEAYRTLCGSSFASRAPGVELVDLVRGDTFLFAVR
jgi:hypothetical protein